MKIINCITIILLVQFIRCALDCIYPKAGVDLSGLANTWILQIGCVASTISNDHGQQYFYFPCSQVPSSDCQGKSGAGVCQIDSLGHAWNSGQVSSGIIFCVNASTAVLSYSGGERNRSTLIYFIYDSTVGLGALQCPYVQGVAYSCI